MINLTKKNEIISQFTETSKEMFETVNANIDIDGVMSAGDVDGVRLAVKKVQNIMIANTPFGVAVPKASLYVSPTGAEEITIVNITVANKISSSKSFNFHNAITHGNANEKVFNFMLSVYTALLIDEMVDENLERVNTVLASAVTEAGLDYSVKVVSSLGNEGKKIAFMSDDEIIFVADEERVFNLDNIIILFEETDETYTEEVLKKHLQVLVDEMATAQTTAQLVGIHGGALVAHVCDISKRIKPMTLIKKVVSKNVSKVRGNKDTLAYFNDGKNFAILARRDGHFEVILSPFDTETLRNVDIDILKEIA